MESNSLHKKTINWPQLRESAVLRATGGQTTRDTYAAIRGALVQLGDHHSFLQPPGSSTGQSSSHPYGDPQPEGHLERVGRVTVARIVIPEYLGPSDDRAKRFAIKLHDLQRELSRANPSGWIVDLRDNLGGNMWPMLAGIGPLLGPGDVGGSLDADSHREIWSYSEGRAVLRKKDGTIEMIFQIAEHRLLFSLPPVAVLIGEGTASSGEAIAICFRGRPQTRFFGRRTSGQSTANHGYRLSDGASLFLTGAVDVDRTGRAYEDGLQPDVEVPAADAIKAAIDWIITLTSSPF